MLKKLKEHKEGVKVLLSILSFTFAVGFAIAGFCVPPMGIIDSSVLWWSAQAFLAAGTFIGLTIPEARNFIKGGGDSK